MAPRGRTRGFGRGERFAVRSVMVHTLKLGMLVFAVLGGSVGCAKDPSLDAPDAPSADAAADSNLDAAGGPTLPDVPRQAFPPANTALHMFGYAYSALQSESVADQERILDAIHGIVGDGGIVRTSIQWSTADALKTIQANDFARFDQMLDRIRARKLRALPQIHTINSYIPGCTGGAAPLTLVQWRDSVTAIINHYKPGGAYSQSVTPAGAPDRANFPGILTYEIWNEPNSIGRGICGTTDYNTTGVDMPVERFVPVLEYAALGRDAVGPIDCGALPQTEGPCAIKLYAAALGRIDLAYIAAWKAFRPEVFTYMDGLTVHVYSKQHPITCAAGSPTNTAWTDEQGACFQSLSSLRTWLDANGGAGVHLGLTEGVYSGSDMCASSPPDPVRANHPEPPNVQSLAIQASWGAAAIDWINSQPGLSFDFFIPFNPIDWNTYAVTPNTGSGYQASFDSTVCPDGNSDMRCGGKYSCNGAFWPHYWHQNLGAYDWNAGGNKPWGDALRARRDALFRW